MIRSMFAGVAGLSTHQRKMDVIGNNIANVNTYGYKTAVTNFQESIYQTISASTDGNNVYGGSNPSQIGYGSEVASIDLVFSTGAYAPTGQATDCMIDGDGFFIVGPKPGSDDIDDAITNSYSGEEIDGLDPNGNLSSLQLTRYGSFTIDGDGYLVDKNNYVVYGFFPRGGDVADGFGQNAEDGAPATGTNELEVDDLILRPIRLPFRLKGEGANTGLYGGGTVLGDDGEDVSEVFDGAGLTGTIERIKMVSRSITDMGVLVGIDEDTGQQLKIAKLAIVSVMNPNALEKTQNGYYQIAQNTGRVRAYESGEGGTGKLKSNGLEMANVDLAKEISDMITTQRGFQANSKIITVSDEMLETLINMKR